MSCFQSEFVIVDEKKHKNVLKRLYDLNITWSRGEHVLTDLESHLDVWFLQTVSDER